MATEYDITTDKGLVEGDDITITFAFKDSAGDPYDLTNVTKVWFSIKYDRSHTDTEALVSLNSTDNPTQVTYGAAGPGAGKVKVIIATTASHNLKNYETLYYDVQTLDAGDIKTLVVGTIDFFREVTKAST
jgi:hypothetical protein